MELLPLPIFPSGALAGSVITTVWVGVFVVSIANLRFGWVLSGLVVPGYIVPLLLVEPWAAAVILLEAVVTYLLVRALSEQISRIGLWGSFFGRDRFFALVLCSVIVRVVFDAFILPAVGAYVVEKWDLELDYRGDLHSFGLIIVALVANLFWKTGLARGLLPLFGTVGITYLLVRYVLMELTNFSIGNLSFVYEDVASSIEASPKAYIVLLTTAWIASRMNLRYGWDFNGILLPSLLALQWQEPGKIATSFAEAFIIYVLAVAVMQLPMLRQATIEGARKLLLFFNIGFAYKLLLGHLLLRFAPELEVTDFYGYGEQIDDEGLRKRGRNFLRLVPLQGEQRRQQNAVEIPAVAQVHA